MPNHLRPRSRHPFMTLPSRHDLQLQIDRLQLERDQFERRLTETRRVVAAGALDRFLLDMLESKDVRTLTFDDREAIVVKPGHSLRAALVEYLEAKGFTFDPGVRP